MFGNDISPLYILLLSAQNDLFNNVMEKAFLEKLTVDLLVNKLSAIYGTQNVISVHTI
jgi:hypothetical protein